MDVKTLCLGVLSCGSATGYEIRKQFDEGPFAHFYDAGYGSIYPALRRLSEDGLIEAVDAPGDQQRPDRKVYAITVKGRATLLAELMRDPAPDKVRSDFTFIAFFGHRLPPAHLDRLIDTRLALYRRMLDQMKGCDTPDMPPGERFVLGLGTAVYRAAADYLETHRHELIGAALPDDEAAD
ncbi:PadR family transcriptional regulator [Arenibaculum sp.]|jgi:DNA-binding PadR family transcriptional regulator|uniref:PadR family transcriptional regulator n=1 Tax=Arenibaculum sp. TaxID=2865862 RepID=UPI002E14AD88|nr:PadR family transcriptional regulator [Arenibaculum sp.]